MKDRYLFRAKELDNGEWVQGNYVKGLDEFVNCEEAHIIFESNAMFYSSGEIDGWYKVDPSTICQCTGLKDIHGNLIWENDIIHKQFYTDYDAYANSEAYNGRIQYEDGGWSVEITKSDGSVCVSPIIEMIAYSKDIENFEVIGNIFDNPELLEDEKVKQEKEDDELEL